MLLEDFLEKLSKKIPLQLACDWDNVGLLVEPMEKFQIKRIILTNDLTEKVMNESIEKNTDLIISYHPPIFRPFKTICQTNWKERIIAKCLVNKIAIYSPHTALDAIYGGINDWLLGPFVCSYIRPVERSLQKSTFEYQIQLNDCNKKSLICDQLKAEKIQVQINETYGIIQCNGDNLPLILNKINQQKVTFSTITTSPKLPILNEGMGRIGQLSEPMKINQIVSTLKMNLGLERIRLALADNHTDDTMIHTIGVCAGSGSSILRQIRPAVDFFITGEMSHHEVLDAIHSGTSIALCEHTNTERGYIRNVLHDYLVENFPILSISMSEVDKDPLQIV
uniref:NIF3-like protein 1 n=1 Tax=Dermatophagoides pteronyssinus TaxID=6956 RepID=A0A6P6YH13_DERPT|nr:NIF3-like protein 1 [Dermatophagoides pteronyssinus]